MYKRQVEDVAADLGPRKARHHARHAAHFVLLAEELGHAENLLDVLGRDFGREGFVESDLLGAGAGDLGQQLVERANARLAGVAGEDVYKRQCTARDGCCRRRYRRHSPF